MLCALSSFLVLCTVPDRWFLFELGSTERHSLCTLICAILCALSCSPLPQDLPRAIPVDCSSDLDVTVPYDPVIKSGALLLDCIGQFQESNASCTPARTSRYRTINTALEDPIVKGEEPRGLRGGDIRLQFWGPQAEGLTRVRGLHCSKGGRRTTVAAQDLPELSLLGRARAALRNKPESGPSADPALTMVIDLDQSGGASRATVAHRLHELSPSKDPGRGLPANPGAGLSSCPGPVRMLTLKVLQEVIDSAIQVYYEVRNSHVLILFSALVFKVSFCHLAGALLSCPGLRRQGTAWPVSLAAFAMQPCQADWSSLVFSRSQRYMT